MEQIKKLEAMKKENQKELQKKLFGLAKQVRLKAHAPYSKFKVGSALIDERGKIFVGCNVESSSYGGTICAERSAVTAMIAGGGKQIREIVIVTDTAQGCPPCGICRQFILEFSVQKKPANVHIASIKKIQSSLTITELLPHAFNADFLV